MDFMDRFAAAAGAHPHDPRLFRWSAIALLAASLKNNVFLLEAGDWQPLYPHLYTFLIAPSGTGKGAALDLANLVMRQAINEYGADIVAHRGQFTHAALYKYLKQIGSDTVSPAVTLFSPELVNSIGEGDLARQFIGAMVELYDTQHKELPRTEATIARGLNEFSNANINWFGASQEGWLKNYLRESDIQGGFLGRICLCVIREVDVQSWRLQYKGKRPVRGTYAMHSPVLKERLAQYSDPTRFQGEMVLTEEARDYYYEWQEKREPPFPEEARASWSRIPAMALKLSMVFQFAQLPEGINPHTYNWREIGLDVMKRATRHANMAMDGACMFVAGATLDERNKHFGYFASKMSREGEMWERDIKYRFPYPAIYQNCLKWAVDSGWLDRVPHTTQAGNNRWKLVWKGPNLS